MQYRVKEWAEQVWEKADTSDPLKSTLDLSLKNVFWSVDGIRTIAEIAEEDNYDLDDLAGMVRQLSELGLIAAIQNSQTAGQSAFRYLSKLLSEKLGPMGDIVLDETVGRLGYEKENFPMNRFPKLVDDLSLEMGAVEERDKFKEMVLKEVCQL